MTTATRLRLCGLSLAAATAACLEIPPPVTGTDAGPDASGDGASGARCGDRDAFVPIGGLQSFGSAGDIDIRDALTADFNGDDIDDLLLVNTEVAADQQGVFVLLGPLDPSDPDVHLRLETLTQPGAVAVAELSGDTGGCLDLVVFGINKQSGNGFIELYVNGQGATPGELFEASPVTHQTTFIPAVAGSPAFIEPGRFGTDSSIDFVVADLFNVALVSIPGVPSEGLTGAGDSDVATSLTFSLINGIFAMPNGADDSIDDLVIVEHADIHWIERDGGNQLMVPTSVNTGSGLTIKGAAAVQIDVPPTAGDLVDILGAGASSIAGWRMADNTPGAIVMTEVPFADPNLLANVGIGQQDGDLDELVVAQLAQGDAPDVVVIDHDTTNGSFAALIVDARRDGASFPQTQVTTTLSFTNFNPRAAVAIDADNDGDLDVYVVDPTTGEGRCLEVNASMVLEPCGGSPARGSPATRP